MITFEEMDERLKSIRKDRAWLAENTGRSAGSIRSAFAPRATPKHRSALLQKALSDAIEAEERRLAELEASAELKTPPADHITLEVPQYRMKAYLQASRGEGQDVKEWAIEKLNEAAEEWRAQQQRRNFKVSDDIQGYNEGNGA